MNTMTQPLDVSIEKDSTYWYKQFQKFQKSGLSKTAYSKQHSLVKHKFMYWSRKFEVALTKQVKKGKESHSDFVAVKMKPVLSASPINVLCTLEIGPHSRLLIHDLSALKTIVTLLESNSCF